jgi:hypothetical protein
MGLNTQANWVKMGFVPMCNSSNFDNAILCKCNLIMETLKISKVWLHLFPFCPCFPSGWIAYVLVQESASPVVAKLSI